jgi:DNA polymerase I-like protein with 3'-5' exonuclease and polymerase domains
MTKTSMVLLFNHLPNYKANLVNTIHDELCIEVPDRYSIRVADLVKRKMIQAARKYIVNVPVLVDVQVRNSWWKGDEVEDIDLLLGDMDED